MSGPLDKLDFALWRLYDAHQAARQPGASAPAGSGSSPTYALALRYQGSLAEIEALGFETTWKEIEGIAHGTVHLDDLERIAAHPNVLSLSYGSALQLDLDHSAADVKARSETLGGIGTAGLWHVDPSSGLVASSSLATGAGVIVGIVDGGIDIDHPVFMKSLSPFATRILRIWDHGLDPNPADGEVGPSPSLLGKPHTYGVEFTNQMIDRHLNNLIPPVFRHRDCVGHGTHVAAVAAGNGNPGAGVPLLTPPDPFNFVGIAPQADIVVVKLLDVKDGIKDTGGNPVGFSVRFHDAVRYILEVAKGNPPAVPARPAVINVSAGSQLGPHDGFGDNEQFLDQLFGPTGSFRKGNILVFSAGNSAGRRQHATITIPAAGEIVVPFELFDTRGAQTKSYLQCAWKEDSAAVFVNMWYREVTAPADVSVAVRVPPESSFSAEVFNGSLTKTFDRNKKRTIEHRDRPPVTRSVSVGTPVSVKRNEIMLTVEPSRGPAPQHRTGIYDIRLKGPPGTIVQAWASQPSLKLGFRVGRSTTLAVGSGTGMTSLLVADTSFLSVGDTISIALDDGTHHQTTITEILGAPEGLVEIAVGLPSSTFFGNEVVLVLPNIDAVDRHLVGSPSAASSVISVAAYDDLNGKTLDSRYGNITFFSARGPLADYSGLGPVTAKPDIAAPGVAIKAALSRHMDGQLLNWNQLFGNRFVEFSGTSMAAPHIAGIIALMLQKKPDLTVDDVRTIFANSANSRPGTNPTPADPVAHREAYGGGMVDTKKAHDAV